MDIDKEIAALPEWPRNVRAFEGESLNAALARLALARELLVMWQVWDSMEDGAKSPHEATAALLAALEPPE